MKKKVIALLTMLVVTVSCFAPATVGAASAQTIPTKIKNFKHVFNISVKRTAVNNVKITNPAGRTLYVQMRVKGKWETLKRIELGKGSAQDVKVVYPNNWKEKTYTYWRLVVPEKTVGNTTYKNRTRNVKFVAMNRKKVSLNSKSAVIMDKNGYILYSKYRNKKRVHASITKLMTTLIAIENGKLNSVVRVSKNAAQPRCQAHPLKKGMKLKKRTLLYAAMLASYNASTVAIAEQQSGSTEAFVRKMNKRAKALGLKNTHYKNPHGLNAKGHYSTAYDSCKLLKRCYKNKTFRKIASRNYYPIRTIKGKRIGVAKSTFLDLKKKLGKKLICGKTGYETRGGGGRCFAGVYKINGKTYYITTLVARGNRIAATNKCWKDHEDLSKYIEDTL